MDSIIKQHPKSIEVPIEALDRIIQLETQLTESYKLIAQIMEQLIEAFSVLATFDPHIRKESSRMSNLLDEWKEMQTDRQSKLVHKETK